MLGMLVQAIILETKDWRRSARFYEGLASAFGTFEAEPVTKAVLWDPSEDFLPRIIIRQAAPGTECIAGIGGRISLSVEDIDVVDRAHELVVGLGARDVEEPGWYGPVYAVRFSDPDGHRFEIAMGI